MQLTGVKRMEGIDIVDFSSGSIIGHTSILTAAHCITTADYVAIHYGSYLKATGWFNRRVHNLWERYWTDTYYQRILHLEGEQGRLAEIRATQ